MDRYTIILRTAHLNVERDTPYDEHEMKLSEIDVEDASLQYAKECVVEFLEDCLEELLKEEEKENKLLESSIDRVKTCKSLGELQRLQSSINDTLEYAVIDDQWNTFTWKRMQSREECKVSCAFGKNTKSKVVSIVQYIIEKVRQTCLDAFHANWGILQEMTTYCQQQDGLIRQIVDMCDECETLEYLELWVNLLGSTLQHVRDSTEGAKEMLTFPSWGAFDLTIVKH